LWAINAQVAAIVNEHQAAVIKPMIHK